MANETKQKKYKKLLNFVQIQLRYVGFRKPVCVSSRILWTVFALAACILKWESYKDNQPSPVQGWHANSWSVLCFFLLKKNIIDYIIFWCKTSSFFKDDKLLEDSNYGFCVFSPDQTINTYDPLAWSHYTPAVSAAVGWSSSLDWWWCRGLRLAYKDEPLV